MSVFELFVIALAGWRLGYFVTHERGPFGVMLSLRNKTTIGGLLTCIKCAIFWTVALMYGLILTPLAPIVYVFAASGTALMLASYTGVYHNDKS